MNHYLIKQCYNSTTYYFVLREDNKCTRNLTLKALLKAVTIATTSIIYIDNYDHNLPQPITEIDIKEDTDNESNFTFILNLGTDPVTSLTNYINEHPELLI